jgi:16S rRNA (cytidine1402-2'-O)-methyltransferase
MLTICPTPIGNLADVTERQRNALASADVIACEDTRTTGKLLQLLGISREDGRPRLVSYHEHNEAERIDELIETARADEVVLVSDAGTPAISDPGFRLVRAARAAGVDATVLPGPVAAVLALVGSGLPADRWTFAGFLPSRDKARRDAGLGGVR